MTLPDRYFLLIARIALFTVYAWFGILKMFQISPANELTQRLLSITLSSMSFALFNVLFGAFEVLIGILFLIPKCEKVALGLFSLHIVLVMLPLILLPDVAWQSAFVPTLEGQYMLKNLILIALAVGIASHRQVDGT